MTDTDWLYTPTMTEAESVAYTQGFTDAGKPLNPFAYALANDKYSLLWLCDNCTFVLANGDSSGVGEDDPEPLSKITTGDLMLGWPERDRYDGTIPETIDFSTRSCDGCGEWHHGTRHAAMLVYV